MSKPTIATLKSFVKKNRANLLVKAESKFDGMEDGVRFNKDAAFNPAQDASHQENTLGVAGIWIVGQSRDWISAFENDDMLGFHVSNSCGSFDVAIQKEAR